jgi:hypothetical protein
MAELLEVQTPASHAPDRRAHVATAMLLLATVAWGFGFTWAKAAQTAINMQSTLPSDASFGPMFVLAARFILAGAILLVVLPAARRGWSVRGIGYATVLGGMLGAALLGCRRPGHNRCVANDRRDALGIRLGRSFRRRLRGGLLGLHFRDQRDRPAR